MRCRDRLYPSCVAGTGCTLHALQDLPLDPLPLPLDPLPLPLDPLPLPLDSPATSFRFPCPCHPQKIDVRGL